MMNYLTMDIDIAYSMVNMKLRDFYSSIEAFCEGEDVEKEELIKRFSNNGYIYNSENNQFTLK